MVKYLTIVIVLLIQYYIYFLKLILHTGWSVKVSSRIS